MNGKFVGSSSVEIARMPAWNEDRNEETARASVNVTSNGCYATRVFHVPAAGGCGNVLKGN